MTRLEAARTIVGVSLPAALSELSPSRRAALRRRLERLRAAYGREFLGTDPLGFVHGYDDPADQEIAGFIASSLAFGNVKAIRASVSAVLRAIGPSPRRFVDGFDPQRDGASLGGLYHRWIRSADLAAALHVLRLMRERAGSIGGFFMQGYAAGDEDIGPALASFSGRALDLAGAGERRHPGSRVGWFFPSPRNGSACKRLCLFLRWMVRGGDGLDLGLWRGVSPGQLVLPLDTHLARISRALGLTRRRTPGWAMAVEATRSLALLDPEDPVKYDFALSRLGILDLCLHGRDPLACRAC